MRRSANERRRRASILLAALATMALAFPACDDASKTPDGSASPGTVFRGFVPKTAYLKDACKMPTEWIQRLWRGWTPGPARGYDLLVIPKSGNYVGSYINTSHSGPYGFLQDVPLVFYGPRYFVTGEITLDREVTLADVAPTYAELLDFHEFPERDGKPLSEILKDTQDKPKLIVTIAVDGGGWNVLEHWPDAWPNMKKLMEDGANVRGATVGSSPSITPAIHTNVSTGAFPRKHGVTAIVVRDDDGTLIGAFTPLPKSPPAKTIVPDVALRMPTFGDLWDQANGNEPLVGFLASSNIHIGFLGLGARHPGGDHDIAALKEGEGWATNPEFYSLPEYVNTDVEPPDLQELDRSDGAADGKWMDNDIDDVPADGNPAFTAYEERTLEALIAGEGFGSDDVTDLFFINFKAPDSAGHRWNMISPEEEAVLKSVDDAIGELRSFLDKTVGPEGYALVLTADHGQTPLEQGGWAILRNELVADIDRRFDKIDNDRGLVFRTSASSFFMDQEEMRANQVTPEKVASFVSRYTIKDNVPQGEAITEGFEGRENERIFAAVIPGRKLPKVLRCAPPADE